MRDKHKPVEPRVKSMLGADQQLASCWSKLVQVFAGAFRLVRPIKPASVIWEKVAMTEWELAYRPLREEVQRRLAEQELADAYTLDTLRDNIEGVNRAMNQGKICRPLTRQAWINAVIDQFKASTLQGRLQVFQPIL